MNRGPAISRDEIFAMVEEARSQKKNKVDHVTRRLEVQYPDLATTTIRRNGKQYNALEYLLGDIESYGTSS